MSTARRELGMDLDFGHRQHQAGLNKSKEKSHGKGENRHKNAVSNNEQLRNGCLFSF